ncbi:MAG: Urmylation protein [Cirrosporium novae-zelandiae]|nr:MAG: Urmylation protein [Cirrosporium novae-zelandiae]
MASENVTVTTDDSCIALREQIRQTEIQLTCLKEQLAHAESGLVKNARPLDHNESNTSTTSQKWPLLPEEYKRYGRQMIIPEIGLEGAQSIFILSSTDQQALTYLPGQLNLRKSSVLIVGAGGLGCPAAAYLAGAGVGTLGLVDGDTVEASNLHRQILHRESTIGTLKVDSAISNLSQLNPHIKFIAHRDHLTPQNVVSIMPSYDLVLDCTDHPTSRYLISDACIIFHKPLVSASALRTEGQLMVLNNPPLPAGHPAGGPCYRCIFPKPPPAGNVVSCADGGILGPVVGTMGVLQALEAIKVLIAKQRTQLPSLTLFSSFSTPQFRSVKLRPRRTNCLACSSNSSVSASALSSGYLNYANFCGVKNPVKLLSEEERVSAEQYSEQRKHQQAHLLIDVREPAQFSICHLDNSINIPWSSFQSHTLGAAKETRNEELPQWMPDFLQQDSPIFVVCRLGNDSQLAVHRLKQMGLDMGGNRPIKDIEGGFRKWKEKVDHTWPEY